MDLMQAMLQAMQAQQNPAQAQQKPGGALARAMLARGPKAGDAKFRGLAALPPYAESKHADQFGATPSSEQGAFQSDAFQNDAFQVS